ncbi:NETR-like protein [Mya arenaria]|uniref:NETR-like protein n=1 Tax=Mya arenaria TaxID=6604 RepID=A0ABY7EW86_MYAAR|nr:NETR-like protein [Mya arenaria]
MSRVVRTSGYECPEKYADLDESVTMCRQEDTVIDNGSVEAGTAPFVEVSTILFKCNVGFITATLCNGTNSLVCQEDGSWKGNSGCKPQLPLTCSGKDPCTNAVASGGRLEVLRDEEWRGVCDDQWNDDYNFHRNLLVACRSLGFQYGVEWIKISANNIIEDIDFWLDEVICSGFESNLNECKQNPWGVNDCNPTKYIGISCGNPCSEASTFPPPRSG